MPAVQSVRHQVDREVDACMKGAEREARMLGVEKAKATMDACVDAFANAPLEGE